MKQLLLGAVLSATVGTGAAAAQTGLEQDQTVLQGFYAIGLADEVRKNCPTISPRLVRAYTFLKSLESYAKNAGYTDADIDALRDSAARDRLEAQVRSDLSARGARPGNTAGYCQVGREEIARGTQAGKLLQSN
ncbi:hypothetical protein PARPLA_02952 [Rhodobacteraceae bacterium THAF1]|uniref:DUF5333 domain-containing protein n=1 Tax=Palleronia sp. THAF1 TaxID=2587842 RepID=UPI000F3F96E6|nr:DUF5333 domain-containing protein [Palleronia sp. THAF1]QFU08353.1 hypothetical protein FIU81_06670 [Palleronia sp. THAF1]VDC29029.1 hypothetical protein PARPLA_02952 [Rhodobacteraceae bacterium THAF1]